MLYLNIYIIVQNRARQSQLEKSIPFCLTEIKWRLIMRAKNLLRISSIQLFTLVYELFYFLKLTSFRGASHIREIIYLCIKFCTTFAVYLLASFVLTYCKYPSKKKYLLFSYLIPLCFEKGQLSLQTKCFFYLSFNNLKEKLFTTCSENNCN